MSSIIRKIISTSSAAKPGAPFNQAVVVDRTVYLSGCLGLDKDAKVLVTGGAGPEMQKALENLKATLDAAGSGIDKVVKCTIFVQDITRDFGAINEEYKKVFTHDFPARSCVQVAKLPLNANVEIECIAVIGDVKTISVDV